MNFNMKTWLIAGTMLMTATTGAMAAGTWNRGANGDVQSLDPHKTSTVEEANIIRDMFTGLVAQDAEANLIPGASTEWTVSPDGKVYTFKLWRHMVRRFARRRRRLRLCLAPPA